MSRGNQTHVVQQNGGRHVRQRRATPLLDDPHILGRKRLLAHELTHVIQQQGVKPKQQASSHPCKGTSLAATYVPSDKNLTVSLGKTAFGNTSKLAAYFGFDACKIKNDWRFFLKSLSV